MSVYVFRPFGGFGKDQDLTYPFPSFIDRVCRGVDEFEIWGNGQQVRDFIYIDDIIEATMKAVELDIQEPINLGTGIPTSFNELAKIMFDISGYKPKNGIKHLIEKPVGVMFRVANVSKLNQFYALKCDLKITIEKILGEN
jgi:GDP-L-fucose synthase